MIKKYYRGKCAVITGAASGIGKQFAISLAKMGTNLVISDINMERLEEVKQITESYGVKVVASSCDVRKRIQLENLAKTAINEFNDIHFIFSNAGIAVGGSFENIDLSQWKRIININLWGMIYTIRAFISKLVEQGFGHVVVTSSIAGTIGIGGLIPYNSTKFANAGFCEALYGEYHKNGINVSIVSPFPLKTNLIESVGIGIPQDIIESLDANVAQMAIEEAKKVYWEKFTKKKILSEGFGGGFTVERAVNRYLKKIKKKKLYIYERRYGKLTQFAKGISNRLYKKIVRIFGKRHVELLEEVFTIVKDMQK